jgi:hypothetical protein
MHTRRVSRWEFPAFCIKNFLKLFFHLCYRTEILSLIVISGHEGEDEWSCSELGNASWHGWRIEVIIFSSQTLVSEMHFNFVCEPRRNTCTMTLNLTMLFLFKLKSRDIWNLCAANFPLVDFYKMQRVCFFICKIGSCFFSKYTFWT